MESQPVRLTTAQPSGRLVKRGALRAFQTLRRLTHHAKAVPGILQQAASDVSDAWRESARPNA